MTLLQEISNPSLKRGACQETPYDKVKNEERYSSKERTASWDSPSKKGKVDCLEIHNHANDGLERCIKYFKSRICF